MKPSPPAATQEKEHIHELELENGFVCKCGYDPKNAQMSKALVASKAGDATGQKALSLLSNEELNERVAAFDVSRFECCRCGHETGNKATLIRYHAPFCSPECAERASDYTLDDGQQMLPDYCHDLNAMRAVELSLKGCEPVNYKDKLIKIATARERAEAFVLTMTGKAP